MGKMEKVWPSRNATRIPPRRSRRQVIEWAAKQAEAMIDAFLADEEPDDLLRLEQAVAKALHLAYERGALEGRSVRAAMPGTRRKQS
jgi:hypothetical protein